MSTVHKLESFTTQMLNYYKNQSLTDEQKLNIVESMLYSIFREGQTIAFNKNNMPTKVMDTTLQWLDNFGTVKLKAGNLEKVRNFRSQKQSPSGVSGKFAVSKNAFGNGTRGDLIVQPFEVKYLKRDTIYDYKNVYLHMGAKIVPEGDGNSLIIIVHDSLIMEQQSRIEWVGRDARDKSGVPSDSSLDGSPATYAYELYNGYYSFLHNVTLENGENGQGSDPGQGGETAGAIYIEAQTMEMDKSAAIRAVGGRGGRSTDGYGAGGNGGLIIVRVVRNLGVKNSKLAVQGGQSGGNTGHNGIKIIEKLF